jgi:CRP/FNR family cyclic AMP-dependent transcriptional regulator
MRKVLYVLTRLSDADIDWLSKIGERRQVAPGTVLVEEGRQADELIILLDGQVSVQVKGVNEVARLGAGEILGEISFIDGYPPSATVAAQVPTQILAIDRAVVNERLEADPAFAARFYRAIAMFLSARLRSAMSNRGRNGAGAHEPVDFELLDTVHVAGARFDRMIKRLLSV